MNRQIIMNNGRMVVSSIIPKLVAVEEDDDGMPFNNTVSLLTVVAVVAGEVYSCCNECKS